MLYFYRIILILLALNTVTLQNSFAKDKIDNIVVFGDSMSDIGNLNKEIHFIYVPPRDGYWRGHFSNGPVWIEYVASLFNNKDYVNQKPIGATYLLKYSDKVGLSVNKVSKVKEPFGILEDDAVGGALATSNFSVLGGLYHIPSLPTQVDNYFQASPERVDAEIQHSLYVLEIGGNDYLHGSGNTNDIILMIQTSLDKLINRGAKYFLIPNLPELSDSFEAKLNPSQLKFRKVQTEQYNKMLKALVYKYRKKYPNIIFVYADVHSYFNQIIKNSGVIGKYAQTKDLVFSNKDYCNKSGFDISGIVKSAVLCETEEQRKTTVFWDKVHPSTAVHCIIGKDVFSLLQLDIYHKKIRSNYNGCIDSLL